jgi:uncharacterized membrane protein YadS
MTTKAKERWLFILGLAICVAVAVASVMLERLIVGDILGSSIIALFMGTIINSFFHPDWIKPALKFVSKKIFLFTNGKNSFKKSISTSGSPPVKLTE